MPFTARGFQAMVERGGEAAGSISSLTRTCCGTLAGSSWRTTASTLELSRHISATESFSTRCATPSWRRRALGAYFGINGDAPSVCACAQVIAGLSLWLSVTRAERTRMPSNKPAANIRSATMDPSLDPTS